MTVRRYSLLMLLIASCGLTACDNQPSTTTPLSHQSTKTYSQATTLQGTVSNQQGRIKSGYIKVTDSNQQTIASTDVQDNGLYKIEIPANTQLPIVLTFHPDEKYANAEQFMVVAIDPAISKYDINPLTTAIAKKAKEMGGYTRSNLVIAAENMVHVPDANKTSTGFRGDPTTQYGGWH
jgi:hypothetical protein